MSLIPTYISVVVMRPGMSMESPSPPDVCGILNSAENRNGFDFLANECVALYSVDRNKIVEHEDILVDDGGYADLEEQNMAAIYAHAADLITARLKKETPARNELFSFNVSFVALWGIHMDSGSYYEPPSIDHIEFHSVGNVIPSNHEKDHPRYCS